MKLTLVAAPLIAVIAGQTIRKNPTRHLDDEARSKQIVRRTLEFLRDHLTPES